MINDHLVYRHFISTFIRVQSNRSFVYLALKLSMLLAQRIARASFVSYFVCDGLIAISNKIYFA